MRTHKLQLATLAVLVVFVGLMVGLKTVESAPLTPPTATVTATAAPASTTKYVCTKSVAKIQQCVGANGCTTQQAYPCFPYGCDPTGHTCGETCSVDSQCAAGAACNASSGSCVPRGPTCADSFVILEANGSKYSCGPYKCVAGHCQQQCVEAGDCAPGYSCNAGRCAK